MPSRGWDGSLLLALTATYPREASALGRLGLAGYLTAFLGTLFVAGDWWFEAFVVPTIAAQAPEILPGSPGGWVLAGVVTTVTIFAACWTRGVPRRRVRAARRRPADRRGLAGCSPCRRHGRSRSRSPSAGSALRYADPQRPKPQRRTGTRRATEILPIVDDYADRSAVRRSMRHRGWARSR